MTGFGDRRGAVRLEVVGALRGTLEMSTEVLLVDINKTGLLVEASSPIAPGSTHTLHLTLDETEFAILTTVRHERPATDSGPAEGRCLIGIEFVSPPPPRLLSAIERLLA